MAGEAVVGALRVILGMDTAQFEDGAKKATKGLDSFGKRMSEVAAGIGLEKVVARVTRAFLDLTFGVIDTADKINKASQKFGIGTEKLSELKYAAEQADVPFESLARGFNQLAKSIKEAQNPTSEQAQAFKILGITVEELKTADPNALFLKVADGIAKFGDGLGKTSLAATIFGKKFGPDLIPLLNQGAAGIQGLQERARALGLSLSKETTQAADDFNSRLQDIGAIAVGVSTQFLANFLPAMAKITNGFTEWAIKSDVVKRSSEGLARTVFFLVDNMNLLIAAFKTWIALKLITFVATLGAGVVSLTTAFVQLVKTKQLLNLTALATVARLALIVGIFAVMTDSVPKVTEGLAKVGDAVLKIMPAETADLVQKGLKGIGIETKALTKDFKDLKNEAATFDIPLPPGFERPQAPIIDKSAAQHAKQFEEQLARIKSQTFETAGAFSNSLAPGFLSAAAGSEHLKNQVSGLESGFVVLGADAARLNDALFKLRGAQLTQESLAPWDQLGLKLQEIENLYNRGAIGIDAYKTLSQRAAFEIAHAWGEVASSIVSPMADAFKTLAQMNKKFAGAAKALAIGEALVNTYLAATKALASGVPPFNYIAAAAVTAAGLANVAKISATEFAQGGSFKVGGVGGIDSQMISFKATPGEMVDVRTPGQQRGAEGSPVNVTLNGESFSRNQVRDLFDTINSGIRDGYRIKLA